MNIKTCIVSSLIILTVAGCLGEKEVDTHEKAKAITSSWTNESMLHEGLQVQIEATSQKFKRTEMLPIAMRIRNNTDKPITFETPVSFPVLHNQLEVICPDGKSAFATAECMKKHLMEKITFAPGEVKGFNISALAQCGKRLRSYPVPGTENATSSALVPGVYGIKIGNCEPIKIEVIDEKER